MFDKWSQMFLPATSDHTYRLAALHFGEFLLQGIRVVEFTQVLRIFLLQHQYLFN